MTRKSKARYNLNRTYKVSQTVKALRRALALGLATAVVAPAAQAGTCISVINDVFCFGDFGDTTLDSWNELAVYDTFDPATVEMDGTIYTDNDRGIIAWNNDDMTFNNDGAVLVNDSPYQYFSYNRVGVYAESFQGDVTFDNTGVIAVVENSNNFGERFTIGARVEAAQDITITNSGFIASENDGGFAAGLQAVSYGGGTISITNAATGDIGAEANDYGTAVAMGVYGGNGTVNITNNGDIGAASQSDSAFGIRVFNADTTITTGSTSEINVQAQDQAFGMDVQAYNSQTVDITNAGLIETDAGDDAYGIRVDQSGYGDVTVTNSGTIDSYAVNDWAAGIAVYANDGDVSVTNSQYGTILSNGNDDSAGIAVRADTGDITVSNAGGIYSTSEDAAGVVTFGKYRNTVDISNSGTIGVVAEYSIFGSSAVGVYAIGVSNDTTVTNSGEIYAVNGTDVNAGVVIFGPGTGSYGTATVTNTGVISAGKYSEGGGSNSFGDAYGVLADVNGDVSVTNTGSYSENGSGDAGILAYNEDGGWTVGVQASSANGNVSVTNSNKYSYVTAVSADNNNYGTGFSTTIGIYAEAFDGSVNVNNGGIVFSVNNNYGNAIGIRAEAYENDMMGPLAVYAADGDITVTNTSVVFAAAQYDDAFGVQAFSNYGDIAISNTGNAFKYSSGVAAIRAIADDGFAAGIQAQTGADGTITVSNTGAYVIADGYSGATGISADTYSGDITVTNAYSEAGYGGVVAAQAINGTATGIDAFSDYGNISVTNSGYVVAESAYGSAFGIDASTGNYSDGTITVTNTGYVIASGQDDTYGINANSDSGAITISNNTNANGYGGVIAATTGQYGYAHGISATINDYNSTSDITITNGYGALITATANYTDEQADSYGVKAENNGDGDILITNAGTIRATSYDDAQAIWAYADGDGDISITNTATGKLYAESADDEAYGIYAYASGNGNITVSNAGSIQAQTSGDYGDVYGISAYADGSGNVSVTNSGSITATATGDYGDAYGIYAGTENEGDVTVTNTGSILAETSGYGADAHGIYAYSDDGSDIIVSNGQYGSITVNATGNQGFAVGIEVENDDSDNYGSTVSITNNGTVTVGTTGYSSNANGIWTHGGGVHDADVTITNNGSFNVTTTGVYSDAWGIEVDDIRGDTLVSVTNNGDVTVAASYGDAFGIQTETFGFETNTNITNNGDLTVSTGGNSVAIGIGAYAYNSGYGDITVTNTANGYVDVSSAYGSAAGINVYAAMNMNLNDGGDISVSNAGDILVQGYGSAYGIAVEVDAGSIFYSQQGYTCGNVSGCNGPYGYVAYNGYVITQYAYTVFGQGGMDVFVNNSGSIDVTSDYSTAEGITVNMAEGDYLASVYNSGDITVSGDEFARGINVQNSNYGNIYVGNSFGASIDVTANKYAIGINADASFGDITVYSEGSISSAASKYAGGIDAWTQGSSTVRNTGDIDATASNNGSYFYGSADAQGIRSWGFENSFVSNSGDITVLAETDGSNSNWSNAGGIRSASDWNTGTSGVYSSGDVSVTATSQYGGAYAEGIFSNANSAWITTAIGSSLTTSATGDDWANTTGLNARANEGNANVYNEGLISVSANSTGYGDARATGIRAYADEGDANVFNSAAITATAAAAYSNWYSSARGIEADSDYGDVTVTNTATGTLTVTAQDYAGGIDAFSDYGDVTVSNAAAMTITSSTGNASGIRAETDLENGNVYGNYSDSHVTVTNSGNITVSGYWDSEGIQVRSEDYGDITVTNTATGRLGVTSSYGTAFGINAYADGAGDIVISNAGAITATGRDGDAYGISAETDNDNGYGTIGGFITINTAAGSSITATASGDYGDAYGIYARVEEDDGGIIITNAGAITATANGYDGSAYGVYANIQDYGDITITNTANITVNANGDYGDAVGIRADVDFGGDISISNSASIVANAGDFGFSAGIYSINFDGSETTISNTGSIKATGDYAWAIYHYGTDVDISNSSAGKIFGVIATDYGNDTFTNNGKWYATEGVNYVSEFNEGDDSIVNSSSGKIYMEDSYIDMGSASQYGSNSFLNNGRVYVNGFNNVVDMGTATSVFTNNGTSLHFEDGAANDHLTIIGDFAGTGKIVVDANGTSMLADRLYIEGDVISNTANVIDVYLDQNPSLEDVVAGELIDIVAVTGTSTAANFNLGIVDVDTDSLYTLDYELVKQINYSGTNDLFSLGFEVSGLTPTGVAMSSIAPTVQNLWHLGVGTVFQREGTKRDFKSGGSSNSLMNAGFKNATGGNAQVADYQGAAGLWLRAFTEDGGLNPDGGRDNFGLGGGHSFDMKNSGIEFGAGYAFNSQWTAGLLGGVSDGSLKPTIGGRTSIDAKTIGGYLTYTPGNGFYADLSYRSMDFDGNGNGGGDDFSFDGKADGYSLEMGYGFKTSSGLIVEPQFQYSSMDVDLDSVDYNQGGFALDDGKSSQTRLGVSLRKTMDSGNGNSWTPYASLSYVNESNASNDYTIGGVLTGNVDTSGNSTLFEGGATVKHGNMLFSGGLNWKDGGAYESVFGGQVSVRFTW